MDKLRFETPLNACKFAITQRQNGSNTVDGSAETLPMLTGYPIVWNATSGDRGGYVARMATNSAEFSKDGVLALYNHDAGMVLGNTANNSLRVIPDDYGTRVEIDLPDTTYAKDVAKLVQGGYVAGMSFGMIPQEWKDSEEAGQKIRIYSKFLVDEVTVTPIPAFIQTTIAAQYSALHNRTRDEQSLKLEQLRLDQITI